MGGAAELIKEVGVRSLSDTDGCLCMHFRVRGISVDVHCRKSNSAIDTIYPDFFGIVVRVHSFHDDYRKEEVVAVAREVASQLEDEGYAIAARFCDFAHDWKRLCVYCNKPREDAKGYVCSACREKPGTYVGQTVSDELDYSAQDFLIEEKESP